MQITPLSPLVKPAAAAPDDVPDGGAEFEKLMALFRLPERDAPVVGQDPIAVTEAEADTSRAYADIAVTDGPPPVPAGVTGETPLTTPGGSVQITLPHRPDVTVAPLEAVALGSTAVAMIALPEPAAEVVAMPPRTVIALPFASQHEHSDQGPEVRRVEGEPEARLTTADNRQAPRPAMPPADDASAAVTQVRPAEAATKASMVNGLAPTPDAGSGGVASGSEDAPAEADRPLNALPAAVQATTAQVVGGRRRPESSGSIVAPMDVATARPGAAADTEFATGTVTRANPNDGRTPIQDAKPITFSGVVAPLPHGPANPAPTATELSADLAHPSAMLRDGLMGIVPTTLGGGQTGPAFSSPAFPNPAGQISQTIVQVIQRGADSPVEVTLRPEELGKVRFDLISTGDRLHVTLYVERPDAMDLIRRHGEQLLNELRLSGFGHPSLSFGEWSQRDSRPAKTAAPAKTPDGSTAAYDLPANPTARTVATGRLDLRL